MFVFFGFCVCFGALKSNWLREINGVDKLPENVAVSIPLSIVTDSVFRIVALQSSYPDIVDWIDWINNARTAW